MHIIAQVPLTALPPAFAAVKTVGEDERSAVVAVVATDIATSSQLSQLLHVLPRQAKFLSTFAGSRNSFKKITKAIHTLRTTVTGTRKLNDLFANIAATTDDCCISNPYR